MDKRGLGSAGLIVGLILAFMFCLPSLLPILAAGLLADRGSSQALASIDWMVSLEHSLVVSLVAGVGGAWAAVAVQHTARPPWQLLGIWLVLTALVPLALLAQCLALALSFTGGTGQPAVLFVGHLLAVFPVTFVLMLRRVALDGEAHYLALRNFGTSGFQAQLLLMRYHYRTEVALGVVLAFFIIFNESAIAGSLGGNTAYFGSVMNAAAFGSADPSTMVIGGVVELASLATVVLFGLLAAARRP